MIPRSAENCFWLQIHQLRAKSNAQFLITCQESFLDGHHSVRLLGQHPLIVEAGFQGFKDKSGHERCNYAEICDQLTWSADCENSIYNNLKKGRTNAHMLRVLLSEKAWSTLNHIWLWLNAPETKNDYQKNRIEFYQKIIDYYHIVQGILDDNMRRDNAYHFMQMGTLLEKLESHSKILELSLKFAKDNRMDNEELFWRTILDAFDGRDPFNSYFGQDISIHPTLSFLLLDRYFPHSIRFSVNKLEESLEFVNWSKSKSIDKLKEILAESEKLLNSSPSDLIHNISILTLKLVDEIELLFNDIREQYSKERRE
jgi:uncharacterized alpha-E superfamily protein